MIKHIVISIFHNVIEFWNRHKDDNTLQQSRCAQRNKKYLAHSIHTIQANLLKHIYIFTSCQFSVYLFVSNKRNNDWIDRAQHFVGSSHDHRERLKLVEVKKCRNYSFWKCAILNSKICENFRQIRNGDFSKLNFLTSKEARIALKI